MCFRNSNNCFGGLFRMSKIDGRNVRPQFDRGELVFHPWKLCHNKKSGISVINKRVSCGMQPGGGEKIYTKCVTGPEPRKSPSKPCKNLVLINEIKKIRYCNAYDLSIKTSPVTTIRTQW